MEDSTTGTEEGKAGADEKFRAEELIQKVANTAVRRAIPRATP